ncbi:DUF4197 domain-containing protein [Aquabacterium sp.]|uniref:DUF4197 domain-containing protein n=1 Tax=Aquabacterium sp. TaxID=1872578 RepID=UPI0027BB1C08|nr:DUF4197 domain-containing protein [Aquabacterium sp.]
MKRRHVLSSMGAFGLGLVTLPTTGWAAAFSSKDATAALRAALDKGVQVAVSQLGANNGFLNNDKVRIGLPSPLDQAAPVLQAMGRGQQLQQLTESMNHAAEQAVSLARPLLSKAIKDMSVQDAAGILQGGDNAVTEYFARKTRDPLTAQFQPIVNRSLEKLSVTQRYNDLAGKASRFGLLQGQGGTLQDHVTNKALDALFMVIGEEERKIRQDPVGTGSALLRKVFGAL